MNHNFFGNVSSESAYWAGFIAADGYIAKDRPRLIVELSVKDRVILENLHGAIHHDGRILERPRVGRPSCILQITSKQVCKDLEEIFGIHNNKTFTLQPPNIDEKFILPYIIGLIDGDGWIGNYSNGLNLGLSGTLPVMSWVSKNLNKILGQDVGYIYAYKSIYICKYYGKNASGIIKHLKNVQVPFKLARKWDEF